MKKLAAIGLILSGCTINVKGKMDPVQVEITLPDSGTQAIACVECWATCNSDAGLTEAQQIVACADSCNALCKLSDAY